MADVTGPGTAISGRASRMQWVAVLSAPERAAASVTTVPADNAAIKRLRVRKRWRWGADPGGLSETTRPWTAARSNSAAFAAGYGRSMPLAETIVVIPSAARALRWAVASIPNAPPDTTTTSRRATLVAERGLATLTSEDDPGDNRVAPPGRYLFEPDGAVIRAGLVTAVSAQLDGWLLDEHIAYVATDTPAWTPYARGFEVLEELPYQEKQLKAALRERGVGRLTIKKRGVDIVPEVLRKRLGLRGDAEATIVLTRAAGKGRAMLVRPLRD